MPLFRGAVSSVAATAALYTAAIHDRLHMPGLPYLPRGSFRLVAVLAACIIRILRIIAMLRCMCCAITVGRIFIMSYRHNRIYGRPRPGPFLAAAVAAGFAGPARAGVIGKAFIV